MKKISLILSFLAVLASIALSAQPKKSRIQPGRMYDSGETLYAPRFGFNATVPAGWEGSLPQKSEVFLLHTKAGEIYGEIFVFGREDVDLKTLENHWRSGVDLSETIKLKAKDPTLQGDVLMAEAIGEGKNINRGNRAFVAARCNPEGTCIVALSFMPSQFYDRIKPVVIQFMSTSTFEKPSNASPYADLNWKEFLSNKSVVTYAYVEGGSKDTEIDLCADGTFTANIKKTGFMKNQNPQYHGRLSGKWTAEGIGEQATLKFEFNSKKNLPPIEITLHIEDDKVLANGERYFVGQSTSCK